MGETHRQVSASHLEDETQCVGQVIYRHRYVAAAFVVLLVENFEKVLSPCRQPVDSKHESGEKNRGGATDSLLQPEKPPSDTKSISEIHSAKLLLYFFSIFLLYIRLTSYDSTLF